MPQSKVQAAQIIIGRRALEEAAPVEQVQPAVLLLVAQRLAQVRLLLAAQHLPADQRLRKGVA
jgi:hypothetical protein